MKPVQKLFFLFSLLLFIQVSVYAQAVGTKKNVILKLLAYSCGDDVCEITLKDAVSGKTFSFKNTDDKTKGNEVFESIQQSYYDNGESDQKLVGKTFKAVIEYRYTDVLEYFSTEEPPRKTGKKKLAWMINEISK